MTTFTLLGHSGSYNRGCEAIVRCTMDLILEAVPDAVFNLVSYFPQTDRGPLAEYLARGVLRLSAPMQVYLPPTTMAGAWDRVRRLATPGFPSRVTYAHRAMLRDSAAVLMVGGDTFTEELFSPSQCFRDVAYLARAGNTTVIWAASIGPFKDPADEARYAAALRGVDLITVRDAETLAYLEGLHAAANVVRVADPAFTLVPEAVHNLPLRDSGCTTVVGLGLSALATSRYANADAYQAAFVALANELLANPQTRIALIPHVTGNPDQAGDDERVCRNVQNQLEHKDRVYVADTSLNTREMKYVISQCDAFIGARTHSTIAAFSSLVPTISVGSTRKVYGINRDLFGHTDYVLPVEEVSAQTLRSKYEHLRGTAAAARAALERQVPRHQEMARAGVEALCARMGMASCM